MRRFDKKSNKEAWSPTKVRFDMQVEHCGTDYSAPSASPELDDEKKSLRSKNIEELSEYCRQISNIETEKKENCEQPHVCNLPDDERSELQDLLRVLGTEE